MKGKRIISSLLSMAMVFTLNAGMSFAEEAPVTEEPVIEEQPVEEPAVVEEQPVIEEEPVVEEQPTQEEPVAETQEEEPEEEESEYPAQTFTGVTPDGKISVEVNAPEGALPKDASMRVENVNSDAIKGLVESVIDGEADTISAVNVIFTDAGGHEVEPLVEIIVNIKMTDFEAADSYQLVHIDQANHPDKIADEKIISINNTETTFATDVFSVYAVIGSGQHEDNARLKVVFHNGTTEIATMYVKVADLDNDATLAQVLYDPGVGTIPENSSFKGWSETPDYTNTTDTFTIEGVRNQVKKKKETIKEGDEYHLYAVILHHYTVSYVDEDRIVIGTGVASGTSSQTELSYTVQMNYTPKQSDQHFEGWIVFDGDEHIKDYDASDLPYKNGTELVITGDVTLQVDTPAGHWLIFDENGKNATYKAPQFVENSKGTVDPGTMERRGYAFGGWYTDEKCTDGNEFTFGDTLSETTTIYAKWTPEGNAKYTVVIWKENIAGDGYDFEESVELTGNPGDTINTVTKQGEGKDTYARINRKDYSYDGFSCKEIKGDTTIAPEGNSVVNVYFDRNEYTLRFVVPGGYSYVPTTDNYGTQYGLFDGEYEELTRGYDGKYYYYYYDRGWEEYTGTRYILQNYTVVKEITEKYGHNIADNFPIEGYANGERWMPGDNNQGWNKVMVIIDIMPDEDITFTLDEARRPLKTMNYYVEALPEDTEGVVTHKGIRYVPYSVVSARYNGVTEEDYLDLNGFTKKDVTASIGGNTLKLDRNGFYIYNETQNQSIYFFYSRNEYSIRYLDGRYVTFDDVVIPEDKLPEDAFKTDKDIKYNADIASYGKDGDNYYIPDIPERSEYTFAGWYTDETCTEEYDFTRMPQGGITVYAKWIQNRYRVFLHPNVPREDTSLDWGSDTVQTNYLVSSGGTVSTLNGQRTKYDLVGWYTDEACTQVLNAESYKLTEGTTIDYDKSDPKNYTDKSDKYGNDIATENKDVGRDYVPKKLDLYAKWRAKLVGAEGINVEYDETDLGVSGSAPTDGSYYLDQSQAICQAASTPKNTKKYVFSHWSVQTWNGSEYVDSGVIVNPGDSFEVKESDAKIEPIINPTTNITNKYIVKLKAVYRNLDEETPTHINWYGNGGKTSDNKTVVEVDGLKINEAIDIQPADTFKKEGYEFKGWAKGKHNDQTGEDTIEEELFLEYKNGKFYTKDGTEVTQVAADENQPYDDLYAIWDAVIYVWHSSTAKKDAISIKQLETDGWTINVQSKVNTNYLYGGCYSDYHGPGSEDKSYSISYDAYAGDRKGEWVFDENVADGGVVDVPQDVTPGTTYYLKEVPNTYLCNYSEGIYKKNIEGNPVRNMFELTAFDDLNYQDIGYEITVTNTQDATHIIKCKSFTFKQDSGVTKTRKANNVTFGIKNDSYLAALDFNKEGIFKANNIVKLTPYWITPDGVRVTGKTRTISLGDLQLNSISVSD